MSMVNVKEWAESPGLGFERVNIIPGSTYRDTSTVVVMPGRDQFVHHRVMQAMQGLIAPMNTKKAFFYVHGDEVGVAYDRMIQNILDNPELRTWKYVLTLETDNLPPADAHIRLLESIEMGAGFDAVSGIYWTKGDINMPMAYGDPAEYERTGVLEFRPRNVRDALAAGHIMPVNGIAMGCALWRLDLFRQLPKPWFVTTSDLVDGKGAYAMTQDLHFCRQARMAGKKFAVDLRVRVGHLDLATNVVY